MYSDYSKIILFTPLVSLQAIEGDIKKYNNNNHFVRTLVSLQVVALKPPRNQSLRFPTDPQFHQNLDQSLLVKVERML